MSNVFQDFEDSKSLGLCPRPWRPFDACSSFLWRFQESVTLSFTCWSCSLNVKTTRDVMRSHELIKSWICICDFFLSRCVRPCWEFEFCVQVWDSLSVFDWNDLKCGVCLNSFLTGGEVPAGLTSFTLKLNCCTKERVSVQSLSVTMTVRLQLSRSPLNTEQLDSSETSSVYLWVGGLALWFFISWKIASAAERRFTGTNEALFHLSSRKPQLLSFTLFTARSESETLLLTPN